MKLSTCIEFPLEKNEFDCSVEKNVLYTARNQFVSSDTLFKQGEIKISYL